MFSYSNEISLFSLPNYVTVFIRTLSATISVTGNWSAVNVLDTLLEMQQLWAGFATGFTKFVLYEAVSATRITKFLLFEAESAVKLRVESPFDLLPNPVFCVVCSFMASLINAMASPRKGSGIFFVGFLAEDSTLSLGSCSFSYSISSSSSK